MTNTRRIAPFVTAIAALTAADLATKRWATRTNQNSRATSDLTAQPAEIAGPRGPVTSSKLGCHRTLKPRPETGNEELGLPGAGSARPFPSSRSTTFGFGIDEAQRCGTYRALGNASRYGGTVGSAV